MKHKLQLAATEEREKWQREYAEECEDWERVNSAAITTLKAKLFAIAGDRLSPQPCYFVRVRDIAKDGQHFTLPVKVRRMDGNRCHHNVALLWEQRKPSSRLKAVATGYALTEDGMWRPHSWCLSGTYILETTMVRLQYFGIPMNAEDADAFAAGFLCETVAEFNVKLEQLKLLRERPVA